MTPRRFARLAAILDRRQPDLTVLFEEVRTPHNLSAIVRTCDAVGVFEVHVAGADAAFRLKKASASGTQRWVGVHPHPDLGAAVAALKGVGSTVIAAHPAPGAVDFRAVDFTRPTAILLGNELNGVSDAALALVDGTTAIPMAGAVASLNVSVAAALLLFEAQRQRAAAGLYDRPRLDPQVRRATLFEWAYPRLAAFCRRKGHPYPRLAADGRLLDEIPRG